MAPPRPGPLLSFQWKLHKLVWRVSGGRLGTKVVGLPVLELVTTGRKSGEPRSVLLNYLDAAAGYAVIASNAGDDRPPLWWLNLQANPEALVKMRGLSRRVSARAADGEEHDELWRRAVAANPDYTVYAERTDRRIPIVVLEEAVS